MRYDSLYQRIVANSQPANDSVNACWLWQARKDRKGYGLMAVRKAGRANPVPLRAHRAMAEIVHGRELHPDRETIEHLCECTGCVNPDHFILLPREENSRAMWERRRAREAARAEG